MVQSEVASFGVDPAWTDPPTTLDPQAQVDQLRRMIEQMRAQLQAEREAGLPSESQLRAALDAAQAEISRLADAIASAKAQAKRRKTEVDEWKQWYYNQPGLDKTTELDKLNGEIAWRAAAIDTLQNQIAGLDVAYLNALNMAETLKHQLAALEAGAHLMPVEQDPRLLSLQEEYEQTLTALHPASQSNTGSR